MVGGFFLLLQKQFSLSTGCGPRASKTFLKLTGNQNLVFSVVKHKTKLIQTSVAVSVAHAHNNYYNNHIHTRTMTTSPKSTNKRKVSDKEPSASASASTPASKAKKAKETKATRTCIEKDATCPQTLDSNVDYATIITWNVNGLRALLNKEVNLKILTDFVAKENPSVLCIQEHKLQTIHVDDIKDRLKELFPSYTSYWACSTGKKGYSGVAVWVKKAEQVGIKKKPITQKKLSSFFTSSTTADTTTTDDNPKQDNNAASDRDGIKKGGTRLPRPLKVVEIGQEKIEGSQLEGRILKAEFEKFILLNCYVPNSGMKLDRLQYRVGEFDIKLRDLMKSLEKQHNKPVILTGDLNVAHLDIDIHNPDAKHIKKSAGTTPEERNNFQKLYLEEGKFTDSFRHFHPEAKGNFTYWSQRAGNYAVNRGLRLDYFICSNKLLANGKTDDDVALVVDTVILDKATGTSSDHCPVKLVIKC